jgi:drug/metabolite transporter (DMT)-like permease
MSALEGEEATAQRGELRGIAWMVGAIFFFVSMDALVKLAVSEIRVEQVLWARYFFHFLLLAIFIAPRARQLITTARLGLQLSRSLLLLVTTFFFFTGLKFLPLADMSALMLVAPIVVTGLSVPILKERVGPRRWFSVVLGLIGALIIIRPGTGVFGLAALLPLGAALCYGLYQITTRLLSQHDKPLTTLFYTALVGAAVMSLALPTYWQPLAATDWALLVAIGFVGATGHFALIKALEAAPASTVTPFGYTAILWATFYGFLFFGELPDLWTLVGAGLIIGSGLYILHRERARRRQAET